MVATGGNQWQIAEPEKRQKQAKTVAVGCDQLQFRAHGKEGVDGSSPSEDFCKVAAGRRFVAQNDLQLQPHAVGMEPFMEL